MLYRTWPFLTVSQLASKIQDNYRVLAAVAILAAVILSAVGTIFTLYALTMEDALASHPNPFSWRNMALLLSNRARQLKERSGV